MKKLITAVAVLACAASIVSAQTVTSANIVGYTKIQAVGGELTLAAINFEPNGLTVKDLFSGLDTSSIIYVWDKENDAYIPSTFGRTGLSPATPLKLGDAVWIQAGGTETIDVVLPGEVLMSETNSVLGIVGAEMTGYYYPVETTFGATELSTALAADKGFVYFWNGTGYDGYTPGRTGFSAAAKAEIISINEGFWIVPNGVLDWEEPRPFDVD